MRVTARCSVATAILAVLGSVFCSLECKADEKGTATYTLEEVGPRREQSIKVQRYSEKDWTLLEVKAVLSTGRYVRPEGVSYYLSFSFSWGKGSYSSECRGVRAEDAAALVRFYQQTKGKKKGEAPEIQRVNLTWSCQGLSEPKTSGVGAQYDFEAQKLAIGFGSSSEPRYRVDDAFIALLEKGLADIEKMKKVPPTVAIKP